MQYIKKDIIVSTILLLILLSANIYTFLFADTIFEGELDRIWYIFVLITGYILGFLVFKLRTFFLIAGVFSMLVLPIEISSLYLNNQPVSMPYMHWIISTNTGETIELLSSVWWFVLLTMILWGIYGLLVKNIHQTIVAPRQNKWAIFGILAIMITSLLSIHIKYVNQNYPAPDKRVYANLYVHSLGMRVGRVFPYDIYLQLYRAIKHQQEIDGLTSLQNYSFGITPREDKDSALYVFVIGESARYHNFSINGEYEHETNPLLSSLPNLILYPHAYAEANATDFSIPLMLTRATAANPSVAYEEKTVAGAFQEAGYKVAWLSTKSAPIRYLQYILPTLDTVWLANEKSIDEVLFNPYKSLINGDQDGFETSSLIVLHTQGSHLNYQDRYPERFDVFKPCLKRGTTNRSFEKF